MRTELAYSEEFNEEINAERAYELYWAEVIFDKRAFRCAHEGCPARYTCANMDKPELLLKQQPHFREQQGHEAHAADCGALAAQKELRGGGTSGPRAEAGTPAPDRLLLKRPAGHFTPKQTLPGGSVGTSGTRSVGGEGGVRSRSTAFYSVRSLVSRWLKARRAGTDEEQTLQVGAQEALSYKEMFECIFYKHRQLSGCTRVYWGTATITEEAKAYRIKFSSAVQSIADTPLKEQRRPTVTIWKDDLKTFEMRAMLEKRLLNYTQSGKDCVVFVYGEPEIKAAKAGDVTFVNFAVRSMDLVSIESTSIYDLLRRPGEG